MIAWLSQAELEFWLALLLIAGSLAWFWIGHGGERLAPILAAGAPPLHRGDEVVEVPEVRGRCHRRGIHWTPLPQAEIHSAPTHVGRAFSCRLAVHPASMWSLDDDLSHSFSDGTALIQVLHHQAFLPLFRKSYRHLIDLIKRPMREIAGG